MSPPKEVACMVFIDGGYMPNRGGLTIDWRDAELSEAAEILAGVTRIEAENAIATLLAKGSITKADLSELMKVKDRIFSDIAGLERVNVTAGDGFVRGLSAVRPTVGTTQRVLHRGSRAPGVRAPPRGTCVEA